ncbi:MAG: metallophosphoesterase [Novosphingobium sp.]
MGKHARTRRRRILMAVLVLLVAAVATCAAIAWRDTTADPVVRRTSVTLPGLPPGTPPLRAVLLSDLHVAQPDMPPERLARVVAQVNALHPDLVFIVGDLISDRYPERWRYSFRDALAPLGGLESRLGTIAVLGNHDHWRNGAEAEVELRRLGVEVLENTFTRRGPLVIGGFGDAVSGHARGRALLRALPPEHDATVILSHTPDVFYRLPRDIPLLLAGHTHCGQIRFPWGGYVQTGSHFGQRYVCGRVDENGHTLIVTAGIGTSVISVRFLVKPDFWEVTLLPPKR